MAFATEDDVLCAVGQRLHLGDDVGMDCGGHLLENDEAFAVPSFTTNCKALFEKGDGGAEAEGPETTFAGFHLRRAGSNDVVVIGHMRFLCDGEGTSAFVMFFELGRHDEFAELAILLD